MLPYYNYDVGQHGLFVYRHIESHIRFWPVVGSKHQGSDEETFSGTCRNGGAVNANGSP